MAASAYRDDVSGWDTPYSGWDAHAKNTTTYAAYVEKLPVSMYGLGCVQPHI